MRGNWLPEGMAQFLSFWAGGLSVGPKDIRVYALRNLKKEVDRAGVTSVTWPPSTFGMGADQLMATLNGYVNAQLAQARTLS